MRASNEEKQKSRARILQAASQRFREKGIEGTGLAEIMKDAGMTHGGFYKHFADKDALVRAALESAFASVLTPDLGSDDFRALYLSEAHRDARALGCPIAALGGEVARMDAATRTVMTEGVEARIALLQSRVGEGGTSRADAIRELAALVGAVVVARAVEGALADEVLAAMRGGADGPTDGMAQAVMRARRG